MLINRLASLLIIGLAASPIGGALFIASSGNATEVQTQMQQTQFAGTTGVTAQPYSYGGNSLNGNTTANPMLTPAQQGLKPVGYLSPIDNSGSVLGASTGGVGGGNSALVASLNGQFDSQINNLQNAENLLGGQNALATNDIQNQYQTQNNSLQSQHQLGQANIDLSQQQLDQGKVRSIRDLTNNVRGMVNNYSNMLGNYGAGSSSANQVINYALGQQANRNYGDLNQQVANQQTGINLGKQSLEADFKNGMDSLSAWRDQQLHSIAANYANTMNQLEGSIGNAKGYQASLLAQYGQTQAAQQALADLQGLDQHYNDLINNFKSSYSPVGQYTINTSGVQVQPVSAGQLQGLTFPTNQATPDTTTSVVNLLGTNKNQQSNLTV